MVRVKHGRGALLLFCPWLGLGRGVAFAGRADENLCARVEWHSVSVGRRARGTCGTYLVGEGLALHVRVGVVPLQDVGAGPLGDEVALHRALVGIESFRSHDRFSVLFARRNEFVWWCG